ncbi:MAG: serine/threonine-protein kinase [Verrucomicrobiales bacterium]
MSERYEIKAKLGEGGAGMVYRAWDTQLNRTVAIKRLFNADGSEAGEKLRKELLREASLLSAIQHPNICQVFDFGVDEDGGFVVMEFVNGENLEEAARRRIGVDEFCALAEQVLEGLSEAHQKKILHRDLKPSNVVISWLPNALFQVKILDFGLAKFSLIPAQQTIDQATHTAKGSVHFMAPEQFRHQPLDSRTDLYSLGCLFYLLLTGQHPFAGGTMAEVMTNHLEHRVNAPLDQFRPDIPPELAQWIGWLMSREPSDRPQSALEALEILRQIASHAKAALAAKPAQRSSRSDKTEPVLIAPPPASNELAPQPKSAPSFIQPANEPAAVAAPPPVPRETLAAPNDGAAVVPPRSPPFFSAAVQGRSKWLLLAGCLGVIVVASLFWAIWRASRPTAQAHRFNGCPRIHSTPNRHSAAAGQSPGVARRWPRHAQRARHEASP